MTFLAHLFVLFVLLSFPAAAGAPEVRIVGSHPALTGELPRNGALYLRLTYRSDIPLRMQAKGFFKGVEARDEVRWNPSPAYPAGEGEAMVWIAYAAPTRLDELRIEVSDEGWQPLVVAKLPVNVSWSAASGATKRAPEWVGRLNGAQQNSAGENRTVNGGVDVLGMLVAGFVVLAVPGYFVLHVALSLLCSGRWRIAALAPLLVMVPAVAHAAVALAAQSTLWPLLVILTAPFAFLYLAGVLVVRLIAAPA
jgi:hypothetical protein